MQILLLHLDDDIALAIVELPAGQVIDLGDRSLAVRQFIPAGHKLAVRAIAPGALIRKYGQPIGRATAEIAPGDHVHTHNLESLRGRGDWAVASPEPSLSHHSSSGLASAPAPSELTFLGYRRRDGRVGVRNHVLVLAMV
jgi:altronate hydrolase